MKLMTLAAAVLLSTTALAADITIHNEGDKFVITPQPAQPTDHDVLLGNALASKDISYIWMIKGTGVHIAVFNDVDPRNVCELADDYPEANVTSVVNHGMNITAQCK